MDIIEQNHLTYLNEAEPVTYNGWTNWSTWMAYTLLYDEYNNEAYKKARHNGFHAFVTWALLYVHKYNFDKISANEQDDIIRLDKTNWEEVYEAFVE